MGTKDGPVGSSSSPEVSKVPGEFDPGPGAAPVWAVGDWWTYTVEYPNAGESNQLTIVVYNEDAGNWYLSGHDRKGNELAEFSHYPPLGAWTKSGFEPTIHGFKIPLFKFPLTDGKTWTDKYRDQDAAWKATAKGSAFEITMTQGGAPPTLTFTYDRAIGFLKNLEFTFGNTRMTLVASGHGYTQPVSVLTFTEHVHGPFPIVRANPSAGAPTPPKTETFTVAGDKALLWGFYYGGAPGAYQFLMGPSQSAPDNGIERHPQTTDAAAAFLWGEILQPAADEWGVAASGATTENGGFVFAEALEVAETLVTPKLKA